MPDSAVAVSGVALFAVFLIVITAWIFKTSDPAGPTVDLDEPWFRLPVAVRARVRRPASAPGRHVLRADRRGHTRSVDLANRAPRVRAS